MEKVVELMQQQLTLQQQRPDEQEKRHEEQMKLLSELIKHSTVAQPSESSTATTATPAFVAFEPESELWEDYWSRFCTFFTAHSVPNDKQSKVFLTNQSGAIYKLLSNLAGQESPARGVNDLTMQDIVRYMKQQFDPKRFLIRERFRFWSDMKRKPGETILELSARIRQAAATCDFASITNPLDEALRTRFICSVNNEAVLKALFKVKSDELTFSRAIEIALETEDAAKSQKKPFMACPLSRFVKCIPQLQQNTQVKRMNHFLN